MLRTPRTIHSPVYPRELTARAWASIKIPDGLPTDSFHEAIEKTLRLIERLYLRLELSPQTDILDRESNTFRECVDGCNKRLGPAIDAVEKLLTRLQTLKTFVDSRKSKSRSRSSTALSEYFRQIEDVQQAAHGYIVSLKNFVVDLVAWRKHFRPQDRPRVLPNFRITWVDPKSVSL